MTSRFSYFTRSFKHKNYRLFFFGQLFSLIGTWIASVATGWLVYRLTNSATLLATVTGVGMLPSLFLSPFAGVVVDRFSRREILIVSQTMSMCQSFAMATLIYFHWITIPDIFILVILQGIVNSFDLPARQTFMSEVVPSKEDLANAIALHSSLFNGARLIGPAIGGFVIAATSEAGCFFIDGISYLAVILSLVKIQLPKRVFPSVRRTILLEISEGVSYIKNFEPVSSLLILVAMISLSITPYMVMLPVYARDYFHGGPKTLGILMACSGCGAFLGALYLAQRKTVLGLGEVISRSGLVLGTGLVTFSYVSSEVFGGVALFFVGASAVLIMASCNTILQSLVDPSKKGRVMAFFQMGFTGMIPIGSLISGYVASILDVRTGVAFGGVLTLFATSLFARKLPRIRAKARAIYIESGVIPG